MFQSREDAAERLVERLRGMQLRDPVVAAVPRGGVVLGALIARRLGAVLDLALARPLTDLEQHWGTPIGGFPGYRERRLGIVAEDGSLLEAGPPSEALEAQSAVALEELRRRAALWRGGLAPVSLRARSVVVVDDGIATGSALIAALAAVKAQRPLELIVAVPVAAPGSLDAIFHRADRVVCLRRPESFAGVGRFYAQFPVVRDEDVRALLAASRGRAAREVMAAPADSRGFGDAPLGPGFGLE